MCFSFAFPILSFAAKDGEALYSQQKKDWELTVAQIMNSLLPSIIRSHQFFLSPHLTSPKLVCISLSFSFLLVYKVTVSQAYSEKFGDSFSPRMNCWKSIISLTFKVWKLRHRGFNELYQGQRANKW